MKFLITIFLLLLMSANVVMANNEGSFLDSPYKNIIHPFKHTNNFNKSGIVRSDFEEAVVFHTPVRSQESRATCSMFSAVGTLEALLVKKFGKDPQEINLSEEWLEYLIMSIKGKEGSGSVMNFNFLKIYGIPNEFEMPYIGETWWTLFSTPLAEKRCSKVKSTHVNHCLLGHRNPFLISKSDEELLNEESVYYDPEFQNARVSASQMRQQYIQYNSTKYAVRQIMEIKQRLLKNEPLTLDLDLYYGAWNHPRAKSLGLNRNEDQWNKGIVFYPSRQNKDFVASKKKQAGHSVVIVGYDDTIVLEKEVMDINGKLVKESYRGVYYFKNSWGTDRFGKDFQINGKSYPGYGMISQHYAHEYGGFYRMPLK